MTKIIIEIIFMLFTLSKIRDTFLTIAVLSNNILAIMHIFDCVKVCLSLNTYLSTHEKGYVISLMIQCSNKKNVNS